MITLLRWSAALAFVIGLSLFAVRVVGGRNRSPAALMSDAGQCTQPCWLGIRPGQTTLDQAQAIFAASGTLSASPATPNFDNERCWYLQSSLLPPPAWRVCTVYRYIGSHTISLIRLSPPQGTFRLGDAVALFGSPTASTLCMWNTRIDNMPSQVLRARIYFKDYVEVWAYNLRQPLALVYDPNMMVYSVNFNYPSEDPFYQPDTPRWRGFARPKRRVPC
jgi:hypothetical protein